VHILKKTHRGTGCKAADCNCDVRNENELQEQNKKICNAYNVCTMLDIDVVSEAYIH